MSIAKRTILLRGEPIMNETHYIPAFTERNGRDEKTACGRWIRAMEHTNEPTCPACKAYVEDIGRDVSAEEMFGTDKTDPLMQPVKPSFGANSDAHYNSYGERRR